MTPVRLFRLIPAALIAALLLTTTPLTPVTPVASAVPPLTVTIGSISSPRYGDNLTFTVRSSGSEVSASVSYKGTELIAQPLEGSTSFSLPTTGRFSPGDYRLDVQADNEASSGTTSFPFTVARIPAHVELDHTTLEYSKDLTGRVLADAPSTVPLSGTITYTRPDASVVTVPLGGDGRFTARTGLGPCACAQSVSFRVAGATHFAVPDLTTQVQVTPAATALTVTAPAGPVTAGEPSAVTVATRFADPGMDLVIPGTVTLNAAPAAGGDSNVVGTAPVWIGESATFDLAQWSRGRSGLWNYSVVFAPTESLAAPSTSTFTVEVVPPEAVLTTTTLAVDRRSVLTGETVTGEIHTRDAAGHELAPGFIEVDGVPWTRAVYLGNRFTLSGLPVGTHRLRAHFTATVVSKESFSPEVVVTVTAPPGPDDPADPTDPTDPSDPTDPGTQHPHPTAAVAASIRASHVTKLTKRRVRLTLTVTAKGRRAATVVGPITVRRGGKIVARGRLKAGRITLTTTRLPRGLSRLKASFGGTTGIRPATSSVIRVRLR